MALEDSEPVEGLLDPTWLDEVEFKCGLVSAVLPVDIRCKISCTGTTGSGTSCKVAELFVDSALDIFVVTELGESGTLSESILESDELS